MTQSSRSLNLSFDLYEGNLRAQNLVQNRLWDSWYCPSDCLFTHFKIRALIFLTSMGLSSLVFTSRCDFSDLCRHWTSMAKILRAKAIR